MGERKLIHTFLDSCMSAATRPAQGSQPNVDLSEIAARWNLRSQEADNSGKLSVNPVRKATVVAAAISTPPPDIRSEFLKLRAELLRKEPLIGQSKSLDHALAEALDNVRTLDATVHELKLQLQHAEVALTDMQQQRDQQADVASRLQTELMETRRQLEEERQAHLKLQRQQSPSSSFASAAPREGSPSSSLGGATQQPPVGTVTNKPRSSVPVVVVQRSAPSVNVVRSTTPSRTALQQLSRVPAAMVKSPASSR